MAIEHRSPAWIMRFGACPPTGSLGWLVHRVDGTRAVYTCGPGEFEEARSTLVRFAIQEGALPVLLYVSDRFEVSRNELDR